MKIQFLSLPPELASSRYRQAIPARELASVGVEIGPGDILIASKHGWDPTDLPAHRKLVFDVCDDHFADAYGTHYRAMIARADAVTCNSEAMRFRIFQETGRIATVIPDPYEFDEVEPSWGEGLLWFGHTSNLDDLERARPQLSGYRLTVICDGRPGTLAYSRETLLAELARCAIVALPTGKSPCKSANRMIEAIRRGKFVAANPLPAYEMFPQFVGSLRERIDFAHKQQRRSLWMVRDAQQRVATAYRPSIIACEWYRVLASLTPLRVAA